MQRHEVSLASQSDIVRLSQKKKKKKILVNREVRLLAPKAVISEAEDQTEQPTTIP